MYRTEINLEKFEFGAKPNGGGNFNTGAGGAAAGAVAGNSMANTESPSNSSDEINYPEEDINPEDIPF